MPNKSLSLLPPHFPLPMTSPQCCPDDESFQFNRFKTKQGRYGFMGCHSPPLRFRKLRGGQSVFLLHLALIAVFLAAESLPSPYRPLTCHLFFLHHFLPVLCGNCTGLSLCACVCARVYTCIDRYVCRGQGKGGGVGVQLRAGSQDTAHSSLSPAPPVLVRQRE